MRLPSHQAVASCASSESPLAGRRLIRVSRCEAQVINLDRHGTSAESLWPRIQLDCTQKSEEPWESGNRGERVYRQRFWWCHSRLRYELLTHYVKT